MRIDSLYLKDIGPFDEVTIDFPEGTNPDLADVYLLTGENGCGKSTVLYAIAALIGKGTLGRDALHPRLRLNSSIAALRATDSVRAYGAWPLRGNSRAADIVPNPWNDSSPLVVDEHLPYYRSLDESDFDQYSFAARFHGSTPEPSTYTWAAFAYAGTRSLTDVKAEGFRGPVNSPFADSLDFTKSADWETFIQWIANQQYRKLKAKDAGETVKAEQLGATIKAIEHVVSEVIDATFKFQLPVDDESVRAVVNGRDMAMDVLPTGLQSIVAWVADLLMRLDRIRWEGNVDLLKRPFLLLLDEIDIHLHPAWQRRILPMVARLFPKAQIIASTHSPFVVASAEQDAHIIRFEVKEGRSTLDPTKRGAQAGTSVSAVLADVFGIKTEFDIETEQRLEKFNQVKRAILEGTSSDREGLRELGREIAARGEELSSIIGFELRQLDRLLATPTHAAG